MDTLIRQIVLECKPNVSHDPKKNQAENRRMGKETGATAFNDAFCARTKAAREAAECSQFDMAELLLGERTLQPTYSKYEVRSPLPHRLIPKFCIICRIDERWLFGRGGKGPAMPIAKLDGSEIRTIKRRRKRKP